MNIQSLTDLLVMELQDLYDAEQQILKALPKAAEAAFSEELRQALELHTEQTREQVKRLEQAFKLLGMPAKAKHCPAMAGMIEEAEEILSSEDASDPAVLDAAIIAAQQKVEHYEISSYGSARTFAETLRANEIAKLLQTTLEEESATDRILTNLAVASVNPDAVETDVELEKEAQQT